MTAQDSHGTLLHMHGTRPTIEGCNGLTLTTDHNPLTSFSVQPTLSRRQARWSEFLSRFHYVVKYRPGALNPDDSLSRLLAPEEAVASLMVLAVTVSEFNSDLLSRLKAETLLDPHFTDEKCTRKYEHQGTYWTYQGRIDVPTAMQLEIIQEHHSNVVSGHFSWSRTLDLISRQLWWPQMRESVQSFVSSCMCILPAQQALNQASLRSAATPGNPRLSVAHRHDGFYHGSASHGIRTQCNHGS